MYYMCSGGCTYYANCIGLCTIRQEPEEVRHDFRRMQVKLSRAIGKALFLQTQQVDLGCGGAYTAVYGKRTLIRNQGCPYARFCSRVWGRALASKYGSKCSKELHTTVYLVTHLIQTVPSTRSHLVFTRSFISAAKRLCLYYTTRS